MNENPMKNLTAKEVVAGMKLGWSLGNTMDSFDDSIDRASAPSAWETAWGNPVTTEALIEKMINEGFNVIRYPVSWRNHITDSENYKIDEAWMNRVQELVDYAYNRGVYVILNIHHEGWHDPYYDNKDAAEKKLRAVWEQIADRFKDYGERLVFECMNEPRKRDTEWEWNGGDEEGWEVVNYFNRVCIDTIRRTGGNNPYRCLMIPGYAANCTVGIRHLEIPEGDDKLIASVHAYEPYDFALNIQGRGLWENDTKIIDSILKEIDELFLSKGTPAIIGEFGAMYKPVEGNEASRGEWVEYYVKKAKEYGIPCVWWDNGLFEGDGELFGLIDREKLEWKYSKVVEGLKKGIQ
ncbi:MAG: glycoside hydrolase family 5 protein [Lachnospiraceae bacterium]|nr:glycoside hydrolase family 5 protein [Lachnospiraceae bacterium]